MVVFLHEFQVGEGNVLSWTNGDPRLLEGLEFTVLPAGIHLRKEDTVYFQLNGKTGIAVFKQNGLDLEALNHHIDRSKVKMFSFGTIFEDSLDYEQLSLYESGMKQALDEWWISQDYKVLEDYDRKKSKDDTSRFNFDNLCLELGPIVLQLWRSALLKERILILNKGVEIKKCSQLCHMLTLLANLHGSVYNNAMVITMLTSQPYCDQESWCATTSDEILIYEEELYDRLVVWDEVGVHLKNKTRDIKCNEVDFTIFKALTSEDLKPYYYQYESSIIWSKLIIDGLFLIFTGNLYKPWYHLEVEPIENPDFYQYFIRKTANIFDKLKGIVDENYTQDTIFHNANLLIELQLDYFNDTFFIQKLSQQWFGKTILLNYIDLSSFF